MSGRAVVQIALRAPLVGTDDEGEVIAVCADGTIWSSPCRVSEFQGADQWQRLPNPPSEARVTLPSEDRAREAGERRTPGASL